jgi:hypothetical protein
VELGTNAKCGVEGVGTIRFQLELRGSLEVADVFYVSKIIKSFLSISTMEDRGYTIIFEDGQVLIRVKEYSLESTRILGNKEGYLYRLKD